MTVAVDLWSFIAGGAFGVVLCWACVNVFWEIR